MARSEDQEVYCCLAFKMNKDSFLQNIVRSIQNRGVFGTFKYVWYDLAFDMKYGIKTLGRTQLEGLTTKGLM